MLFCRSHESDSSRSDETPELSGLRRVERIRERDQRDLSRRAIHSYDILRYASVRFRGLGFASTPGALPSAPARPRAARGRTRAASGYPSAHRCHKIGLSVVRDRSGIRHSRYERALRPYYMPRARSMRAARVKNYEQRELSQCTCQRRPPRQPDPPQCVRRD